VEVEGRSLNFFFLKKLKRVSEAEARLTLCLRSLDQILALVCGSSLKEAQVKMVLKALRSLRRSTALRVCIRTLGVLSNRISGALRRINAQRLDGCNGTFLLYSISEQQSMSLQLRRLREILANPANASLRQALVGFWRKLQFCSARLVRFTNCTG
jgi:hypothetical protein